MIPKEGKKVYKRREVEQTVNYDQKLSLKRNRKGIFEKDSIIRKSSKVKKNQNLIDHLVFFLQVKGEGTAVFWDNDSNKLIVAANTITKITQKGNELYKYIENTLIFFHHIANDLDTSEESMIETFVTICKSLLSSLQKDDPFKYLCEGEEKAMTELIRDFYHNRGVAKQILNTIGQLKKKYSNAIALQMSKVGYILTKTKHSFDKIIRSIKKKGCLFHEAFKDRQDYYNILHDCDEISLIKKLKSMLIRDKQKAEQFHELIDDLTKQSEITQASKISMHLHAEMKIVDHVLPKYLEKLRKESESVYIGSSKLFCYDCHLMEKAINTAFGNILKLFSGEETLKADSQQILESRGTHGLEFTSRWLLPKLVLSHENLLNEYALLKTLIVPKDKGMMFFDSSLGSTLSQHTKSEEKYMTKNTSLSKTLVPIFSTSTNKINLPTLISLFGIFLKEENFQQIKVSFSLMEWEFSEGNEENALIIWKNLKLAIPELLEISKNVIIENFDSRSEAHSDTHDKDELQNAFNQRANASYLYQATDLKIIQIYLMQKYKQDFVVHDPIGDSHNSNEELKKLFSNIKNGAIGLCMYNIGNYHWVAFAVLKSPDKTIILYKDSKGNPNKYFNDAISKIDKKILINCHTNQEQTKGLECGIFALKNIEILAEQLTVDRNNFVNNFKSFKFFCTLELAESLRYKNNGVHEPKIVELDFADHYVIGLYKMQQAEQRKQAICKLIHKNHQEELDSAINIIGNGQIKAAEIVVQPDYSQENNKYKYSYHIEFKNNLQSEEKEQIIKEIERKLKLKKEVDYQININGNTITSISIFDSYVIVKKPRLNLKNIVVQLKEPNLKTLCRYLSVDDTNCDEIENILKYEKLDLKVVESLGYVETGE